MFYSKAESQSNCEHTFNAADPTDFRAIYDGTMSLLYKISYKIVNDEEAAEDLVHDSLIKANEKGLVFPSLNDAKFWLIRVVKNASLNYVKRKQRERKAYEKALHEDHRHQDSGETDLLKSETVKLAQEALNKLPTHLKEVLILREYGDLNYKEIGKVLGITEGNVKVRVFRAREKLMSLLGEDDVYLS
ncbi:MAG: RNA polymerase sigma factor [Treponema sp.]|nr:RNA polymerase sigma factor [Treponema sp.]